MYYIILNISTYMLLLSSVLTIIVLLKRQFKEWRNTPLYILSISDVLFSIFTSSILFTNFMIHITYLNHNKVNNKIFPINESTWNIEDVNSNQQIKFKRFMEYTINMNQNNFNMIPQCNIIKIIIKYGMLFFPFTNSFVSLLIFSVQCNLNAFHLTNQYFKLLQTEEMIYKENININKFNTEIKCDSIVEIMKSKRVSEIKKNMKNILHIFKCNKMKKDKKFIIIFILNQWILPIIVIGLLYFSEYDTNLTNDMENKKCFSESILFLDDCYNIKFTNIPQNVNFEIYKSPLYEDYVNKDLMKTSNTTQVNEIISKVQNLVFSAMNDTYTIPSNIIFQNVSEFLNIKKYFELDHAKAIKQNKSIESESKINNIENDKNLKNNMQINNYIDKDNKELLFNSLKYLLKEKISNNKVNNNINITEKLNFKQLQMCLNKSKDIIDNFINIIKRYNTSIILNDQIYVNVFKCIYNISEQNIQNYQKDKNHLNKKQQKELKKLKSKEIFQYNSIFHKQNELSNIKINIYQNDNASKIIQEYVDKCFISTKFLKIHLFALIFVIYFLPILFSSILQQYGKLKCQIILKNLKAEYIMQLNNFNSDITNKVNNIHCNISMNSKKSSNSKDVIFSNENIQESINFNKLYLTETQQKDFKQNWNEHYKDNQQNISFHEKRIQLNAIYQIENMLHLFNNIKMSLLCGILLWTPLFFECLMKVFTVLYIPEWLLNITYLTGISFNTLRNIFNLKMIKLQEKNMNNKKTNSIHPII